MTSAPSGRAAGQEIKPAIVLAAFGTTEPQALEAIINIKNKVEQAFPDHETRLAFTSRIIRRVWSRRAADESFKKDHPGIPTEIYTVKSPLSTLALLAEDGPRPILVQSLHVTDGAEYRELAEVVAQLAGIKASAPARRPFPDLRLGPPALGDGGERYLTRAARALKDLVRAAEKAGAVLVLMGHGNEHLHQAVYGQLEQILRSEYRPDIFIGLVEGQPGLEEVLAGLDRLPTPPARALLAPLMVVAGDHAKNDLAGDDDDSWASVFRARGLSVETRLRGLGSDDDWADIYLEHIREALQAANK